MPYPGLLHPEPLPLKQSSADPYLCKRHSNTVLAQSLWGLVPGVHKFCLSPPSISSRYGIWFETWFRPFYHLAGASLLPLNMGYFYFVGSNSLLSTVVQQWVVILAFSQEKMSSHPSTPLDILTRKLWFDEPRGLWCLQWPPEATDWAYANLHGWAAVSFAYISWRFCP